MPVMIPPQVDPSTQSTAEKKVFNWLRMMKDTDDWIIIHSLGLAKHLTQAKGEADFIALIPGYGMFVFEVKGGRISYEDGKWFTTNRDQVKSQIHPITEADNFLHSMLKYLKEYDSSIPRLDQCLAGIGIIFPDISYCGFHAIPDIDAVQVADHEKCSDLRTYILEVARFTRNRNQNPHVYIPQKKHIEALCKILRPNFVTHLSISSIIKTTDSQTITLTNDQQAVFDGMLENERCLIKGGAGTGKTILAYNYAKAVSKKGLRVGLFCKNIELSKRLNAKIAEEGVDVFCDSFTEFMDRFVQAYLDDAIIIQKREKRQLYYTETLPQKFFDTFIESNGKQFDVLIIDEAQDLIDEHYIGTIDCVLKNGLEQGKWYFFMDAEKQNLYHAGVTESDVTATLQRYCHFFSRFTLYNNCRNSPAIIEQVDKIFGTTTRFITREDRGLDVRILNYRKNKNQAEKLTALINELLADGVILDDIVILSTVKKEKSIVDSCTKLPITENFDDRNGKIYFSTIHSFKGLESSVVILVDCENLYYDNQKNLLYVGMTRAKNALFMLTSEKFSNAM